MSEPLRLPVGVYYDVKETDYHADCALQPSLSSSLAKDEMWPGCALKGWLCHPRLNPKYKPRDPSKRMEFGSLAHKLVLGRGAEIDICTKDDWKTDFAKDFKKDSLSQNNIPCLQKDYDRAVACREGFLRELKRLGILEDFEKAKREVVIIWCESGIYFRCMIDALLIDESTCTVNIFDLKTTEDASLRACERRISDGNLDIQEHVQIKAVQSAFPHLAGRIKHAFLFTETEFPFLVTPYELSGEYKHLGTAKFTAVTAQWREGMTNNRWPGYSGGIVIASPKSWSTKEVEERLGMA